MGRKIETHKVELILKQREQEPEALGPMLGELAVKGNVPVEIMAKLLKVTEPTVYRWMYNQCKPNKIYEPDIKRLLTIIRKASRAKDLPLDGTYKQRIAKFIEVVKEHKAQVTRT